MAPQSNDFLILPQTDIPFKNRSEKKDHFHGIACSYMFTCTT